MSDPAADPVVAQLREQISDTDLVLLDALNRRLELVARLHEYKSGRGYNVIDQSREDWMLAWVARSNRGPLSADAVRTYWRQILDLTTAEAARLRGPGAGQEAVSPPRAAPGP
jgi:chorismate mutase